MKPADKTNIFSICDELNDKGVKPTLARVREALGGGSFSSIQPLLREWKDQRQASAITHTADTPSELIELAKSMATQIWAKTKAEADLELKAVKKELGEKLASAEEERDDAMAEIKKLEGRLDYELKHSKELVESIRTKEEKLRTLEFNKNVLQDKYEDLLYVQTKYEKVLQEVGELRGVLSQKR